MQAHAIDVDSLHIAGPNERCSSDSDTAGLSGEASAGDCAVCVWDAEYKACSHARVRLNFTTVPGTVLYHLASC